MQTEEELSDILTLLNSKEDQSIKELNLEEYLSTEYNKVFNKLFNIIKKLCFLLLCEILSKYQDISINCNFFIMDSNLEMNLVFVIKKEDLTNQDINELMYNKDYYLTDETMDFMTRKEGLSIKEIADMDQGDFENYVFNITRKN